MPFAHELCRPSFDSIAGALGAAKGHWLASIAAREAIAMDGELAGICFSFDFDDPTLADDLFLMFGGSAPRHGPATADADITASLRIADAPDGWGFIAFGGRKTPPAAKDLAKKKQK